MKILKVKKMTESLSDRELMEWNVTYAKNISDNTNWIKGYFIATIVISVIAVIIIALI